MDTLSEEVNGSAKDQLDLELSAIMESKPETENELKPEPDADAEPEPDMEEANAATTLQQLKAKKNKSNLFLIKSYSFIERNNNNNCNGRMGSKLSSVSVPSADLLQSPDLQPFDNIESILLAQATETDNGETKKRAGRLKKPKKEKPPKQPKIKSKTNTKSKDKDKEKDNETRKVKAKMCNDIDVEPEEKLLRRKQTVYGPPPLGTSKRLHEYEEILEPNANGHGSLPRPQSLPAKVHFENAAATTTILNAIGTVAAAKRSSANIKRESFLRQSLQSIRRSFGSNKHSSKLAMAPESPELSESSAIVGHLVSSSSSSTGSTTSAVSCSSSNVSTWSSNSAAINLLTKAAGHNRRLDEIMPAPVVLLLNDSLMLTNEEEQTQLYFNEIDADGGTIKRSTSSVSAIATGNTGIDERICGSLLQNTASAAASGSVSIAESTLNDQQTQEKHDQILRHQQYCQQLSLQESTATEIIKDKDRSLRHSSSSSFSPLNQLQTSGSVRSLGSSPSPSPRSSHSQSSGSAAGSGCNNAGNTAKQHDQQISAVAIGVSSSSAAATANSAAGTTSASSNGGTIGSPIEKEKEKDKDKDKEKDKDKDKDKEKEKKRKEVSSSRVKKFHRHFTQISKDEKLINYFSCALVSDILLQGHLYITDQHFAFYSNVFGYVTKVVIPTTSVTKISKEKMAKIIPNAVGVATVDERHVFGSFISRESAFRLMCTVCPQLAAGVEILPKPLPVDSEMPEEFFNEDDSSCSISGNESPPQQLDSGATSALPPILEPPQAILRQRITSNTEMKSPRHSDVQSKKMHSLDVSSDSVTLRSSAPPIIHYEEPQSTNRLSSTSTYTSANASASSGPPSSSSSPITVVGVGVGMSSPPGLVPMGGAPLPPPSFVGGRFGGLIQAARSRIRLPVPSLTELHILYLGIMLSIMLALFSAFLLYRILDIEAKTSLYQTPIDFNWHKTGNDEDIFAEALRWQKELQAKSTAEAQHILSKNLEQITKVRRSLETLSMLIHDRRAGYGEEQEAAGQAQQDLELVVSTSGQSISDNSD